MSAGRCFVLTVGVLVLFTVARSYGLLGPNVVAVSLLMAALILIAWSSGATFNNAVRGIAASADGRVLLVLGSIAVTFVAGLIFCWLRLRSRSLIAPIMAHVATNGLALTVAWFAVH